MDTYSDKFAQFHYLIQQTYPDASPVIEHGNRVFYVASGKAICYKTTGTIQIQGKGIGKSFLEECKTKVESNLTEMHSQHDEEIQYYKETEEPQLDMIKGLAVCVSKLLDRVLSLEEVVLNLRNENEAVRNDLHLQVERMCNEYHEQLDSRVPSQIQQWENNNQ